MRKFGKLWMYLLVAMSLLLLAGCGKEVLSSSTSEGNETNALSGADTASQDIASGNESQGKWNLMTSDILGDETDKSLIKTVTFLNSLDSAPESARDISYSEDKSVMAWLEPNESAGEEETLYDLYIAADGDIYILDGSMLFEGYSSVTDFYFNEMFYVYNSADEMFYGCKAVEELDLNYWDTSTISSFYSMFSGCTSLKKLEISDWDLSSAYSMFQTFYNCTALTDLDISNWDTSHVSSMRRMFAYCESLTELDISGWDTSNVKDMDRMFFECSSLKSLDLSGWDTSNVTEMTAVFYGCSSLESLNASGWDLTGVTTLTDEGRNRIYGMFAYCESLTDLDVCGWKTSTLENISYLFYQCSSIEEIDLSDWDLSNVTNSDYMFSKCDSLTNVITTDWDTAGMW